MLCRTKKPFHQKKHSWVIAFPKKANYEGSCGIVRDNQTKVIGRVVGLRGTRMQQKHPQISVRHNQNSPGSQSWQAPFLCQHHSQTSNSCRSSSVTCPVLARVTSPLSLVLAKAKLTWKARWGDRKTPGEKFHSSMQACIAAQKQKKTGEKENTF